MDARHFRRFAVGPTLDHLGLNSPAAENLLVGTAACESGLFWLKPGAPAPLPAADAPLAALAWRRHRKHHRKGD